MKIYHEISSDESSQNMIVDFYLATKMGPLYFKPLIVSSVFMSAAEREAKIAYEVSRISTRLRSWMDAFE